MKRTLLVTIISVLVAATPLTGTAQCKTFTKKCLPRLSPYIHNGQLNSTTLAEGETAELMMTFYSGQNYRILLCSQENLGKVQFQLMDQDRNMIFDNKDHDFANQWDFNVNSTMRFIIGVAVSPADKKEVTNEIVQTGCISLLIGFKD